MKKRSIAKILAFVLGGIVLAVSFAFLLGLAVMLLWNWLMTDLFGLSTIGYWQALGILVLCHLLFKSHVGRLGGSSGKRGRASHHFKERVREKLRDEGEPEVQAS